MTNGRNAELYLGRILKLLVQLAIKDKTICKMDIVLVYQLRKWDLYSLCVPYSIRKL